MSNELLYPRITLKLPFRPVSGIILDANEARGMVAFMEFTLNGKLEQIPLMVLDTELGNGSVMLDLMDNAINAAHDYVDQLLGRGAYAPQEPTLEA